MKDLKNFIIKLLISAIVLTFAFIYLDKPKTTAIQFPVRDQDNTPPMPAQLKWHDNFKGIENVPSKPKVQTKENK